MQDLRLFILRLFIQTLQPNLRSELALLLSGEQQLIEQEGKRTLGQEQNGQTFLNVGNQAIRQGV